MAAARREFEEETGTAPPPGALVELGEVRQRSGKRVTAWAAEGDLDPARVVSNTFLLEWPPRSGRMREFPEVDRAGWFPAEEARRRLVPAQAEFVDRLLAVLDGR
jgi:predicted NUDIX family NTP pyrophosphohydrolase